VKGRPSANNNRISAIKGQFKNYSSNPKGKRKVEYSPEVSGFQTRNLRANVQTPVKEGSPKMHNAGTSAIRFYDPDDPSPLFRKPSTDTRQLVNIVLPQQNYESPRHISAGPADNFMYR